MLEIGFQDQQVLLRSRLRARDASPNSVIFTLELNFSLFFASASVDRCSFASNDHDHEEEAIGGSSSEKLAGDDWCRMGTMPVVIGVVRGLC